MRHAQSCFSILGGQLSVTCGRCNACTVTGEGTSFWNIVRQPFIITLVHAAYLRGVSIRTYILSNIIT